MKCPTCGAWSEVLETRATDEHMTRRTRVCGNNHRFTTFEVHPAMTRNNKRDRAKVVRRIDAAIARWKRDLAISSDFRSTRDVAEKWGITRVRVAQIRRSFAILNSPSTKKGNAE